MSVFKDNWDGYAGKTWMVSVRYKDWKNKSHQHRKRGFATKKEAQEYERDFIAKKTGNTHMAMDTFINIYLADLKPQIKLSTYLTKVQIIDTHIRPYFGEKPLEEVTSTDILQWQNELLSKRDEKGKGYSETYLRTVHNQLNAMFNHATKYYKLADNPCVRVKKMGKSYAKEMDFWTKDEYMKFADAVKDKPVTYYAFEILYWTGIRCGELLGLTKADFDFEKRTMKIDKQLQVLEGEEMITSPKTEKSNRIIELPQFLCDEMEDYFGMLYKLKDNQRVFDISKSYLHHEMDRGSKKAGVKRIRVHDCRHSACAALIELGFSPVQIAERLGHESATITTRYAHLYPSVQRDMANGLDQMFRENSKNEESEE